MKRSEAVGIRKALDNLVKTIPMANEAQYNESAAAINENAAALRVWLADKDYVRGDICVDPADGVPYWAIHDQGPTSGQVHQPSMSPTMWCHCHGTSKETARPFRAESYNTYRKGHWCTENGAAYKSLQDDNVFPPSVLPNAWEVG